MLNVLQSCYSIAYHSNGELRLMSRVGESSSGEIRRISFKFVALVARFADHFIKLRVATFRLKYCFQQVQTHPDNSCAQIF
jgi:hypothetical protein